MPVSRQPPKRKVQLSLFLLLSTKIQTEPEYHLIGKILPLSNTWLQGYPVVCPQVQEIKSQNIPVPGKDRKESQHSLTTSRGAAMFSYSQSSCMTGALQRCCFSWQGGGWDTAGAVCELQGFQTTKAPLYAQYHTVKTSQNLLSMSNPFWMNTAELVGSLHYKQLSQVGFKTSPSWSQCKSSVWGRGGKTASCSSKQHSQTTSTLQAVPVGVVAGSVAPAPELY